MTKRIVFILIGALVTLAVTYGMCHAEGDILPQQKGTQIEGYMVGVYKSAYDVPGKSLKNLSESSFNIIGMIDLRNDIEGYHILPAEIVIPENETLKIDGPIVADKLTITDGSSLVLGHNGNIDAGNLLKMDSSSSLGSSISIQAGSDIDISAESIDIPIQRLSGNINLHPGASIYVQSTVTPLKIDTSRDEAKRMEELTALKRAKDNADRMKSHFDEPAIVNAPASQPRAVLFGTPQRQRPYGGNGATLSVQTTIREPEE